MSRFLRKLFSKERRADRPTAPTAETTTEPSLAGSSTSSFFYSPPPSYCGSTTSTLVNSSTATLAESTTSTLVERAKSTVVKCAKSTLFQPEKSRFEKLEPKILQMIRGHLELHDHFLLGQTCQAWRRTTARDWKLTLDQLPLAQKLEFWAGVALVLPNHWACGPCYRLHKINRSDIPWKERGWCERQSDSCQFENAARFGPFHKIEERHVQLALKFTRMKTVNQEYLKSIMKPFTDVSFADPRNRPAYMSFHAAPKIVAGRFLLHTKWVFGDGVRFCVSQLRAYRICPHMFIRYADSHKQRLRHLGALDTITKDLTKSVNLALESPGKTFDGHCSRCPTDFSVLAGLNRITISSWHDFGTYKSPEDDSWNVHVESHKNRFSTGPVVHHEPGSVQKLYTA